MISRLLESFDENTARCLFSSVWSHRCAALRHIQLRVTVTVDKYLETDSTLQKPKRTKGKEGEEDEVEVEPLPGS